MLLNTLFDNFVILKVFLWASNLFLSKTGDLKNLKKLKNMEFNWKLLKKARFSPKMAQKAPRDPLGPPGMAKIIVPSCQDMKTQWKKKEFLNYLP